MRPEVLLLHHHHHHFLLLLLLLTLLLLLLLVLLHVGWRHGGDAAGGHVCVREGERVGAVGVVVDDCDRARGT